MTIEPAFEKSEELNTGSPSGFGMRFLGLLRHSRIHDLSRHVSLCDGLHQRDRRAEDRRFWRRAANIARYPREYAVAWRVRHSAQRHGAPVVQGRSDPICRPRSEAQPLWSCGDARAKFSFFALAP